MHIFFYCSKNPINRIKSKNNKQDNFMGNYFSYLWKVFLEKNYIKKMHSLNISFHMSMHATLNIWYVWNITCSLWGFFYLEINIKEFAWVSAKIRLSISNFFLHIWTQNFARFYLKAWLSCFMSITYWYLNKTYCIRFIERLIDRKKIISK